MKERMNLDNFPSNETARDMLGMVTSGWYDNSYVGKWIFQVEGIAIEDAKRLFEELRMQAFPQTATWGLCYHEQKYGMHPEGNLENRRKAVLDRKFNRLPFNPEVLKLRIENYSGYSKVNIDILVNYAGANSHKIIFYEDENNIIKRTDGLVEYVNKIKQSHAFFDWNRTFDMSFQHNISNDYSTDISMDFYPRYNLAPLLLDGTWLLDGSVLLGAYKTGERVDFNPMSLDIGIDTKVICTHTSSFNVSVDMGMKAAHEANAEINMEVDNIVSNDTGTDVCVETNVSHSSDMDVTIKNNYWLLDGSVLLDGSRFLCEDEINVSL